MKSSLGLTFCLFFILLVNSSFADNPAEALFQKCVEAEDKTKSIQANFTIKRMVGANVQSLKGALKLQKPNRVRVNFRGGDSGSDDRILNSDGKKFINYIVADNEYEVSSPDPSGGNIGRALNLETSVFFNSDILGQMKAQGTGVKIVGTSVIGGVSCKEIKVTGVPAGVTYKIYVGSDFLLRGSTIITGSGNEQTRSESRLTELKANPILPASSFTFTLPKGAKTVENRIANDSKPSSGTSVDDTELLLPGRTAPDFEMTQIDGTKIKLSALTKANRVVLLMFWSKNFEPCRDELPELEKTYRDLKSKGLEILTINTTDSAKNIQKFWVDQKLSLRAGISGEKTAEKYHVGALPTNYLIGNNGKVLARFEGYDDAGILSALGKAGVK